VNALKGHFVSLGTNTIGARTVESVMQLYPPSLTRSLKVEFYGKKYIIMASDEIGSIGNHAPQLLSELIARNPAKRDSILDHMRDLTQKLIEKGLLEFTYVHHLLWEYIQEVKMQPARMDELIKVRPST
jgi:hypothetical protein